MPKSFARGYSQGRAFGTAPISELWSGTKWTVQRLPSMAGANNTSATEVSCTSPTECMAVGREGVFGTSFSSLSEQWNGTQWTMTPTPNA
jgi:hypothetical protein